MLLSCIYKELWSSFIERDNKNVNDVERDIRNTEYYIGTLNVSSQNYKITKENLNNLRLALAKAQRPPVVINGLDDFVLKVEKSTAILSNFGAMRKSEIVKPTSIVSFDKLREQDRRTSMDRELKSSSSLFEQFLVSNMALQAFSESPNINNDAGEAKRINKWFVKLEEDLKNLFEDNSLNIKFKSDTLSFEINQSGKKPYTLQSLSSGFSSIMAIYAELITKVSLYSVDPSELTGVVLIDEIDAHLHVSLQKKILSFLTISFPKVQFIVTTHSPFVVSSVEDAVIYDLSSNKQIDDLSMYSYESILEGLFDVLPVSNNMQEKISYLNKLTSSSFIDIAKIKDILSRLPKDDDLDPETLYYVNLAKVAIRKSKKEV